MLTLNYHPTDVNQTLATDAHRGTSFSPEKRAQGYIDGYLAEMTELVAEFEQYATADTAAAISADLERYRQGYLKRLHAFLAAHRRVLSVMIAGPSNFPVRRNEKANAATDRRRADWLIYCEKAPARLRQRYDPRRLAHAPIRTGEADAGERLQAKIAQAERWQATMKAANAIVRRKRLTDDQKVAALLTIDGISREATARKLLEPDELGRVGFADYQLKNNAANLRRLKARLAELEREQARREAAPATGWQLNGATVSENAELNRLQIVFTAKPPAELRARLKAHGFKWAPSQGAWQRQLTANARQAARLALAAE